MSRQFSAVGVAIAAVAVLSGCHPQQPFYLHEDGDLSHYLEKATEIEFPDLETQSLGEVDHAIRPFSLQNSDPNEIWKLTLEEAVQNALANSKVMRSIGGQIIGPPDFLVRNGSLGAPTVYDPASVESDPRFGTEAALSAFDAQLSSSVFWEKNSNLRNAFFIPVSGVSAVFPSEDPQDVGGFQAQVSKTARSGGTWTMRHNVQYDLLTKTPRIFTSDWNVNLEAEVRQPLLQGKGAQFNGIAGPGATPGDYRGVMIARINTDVALCDFEASVRNLVSDVEVAYWELYFAYRNLDAAVAGRDRALRAWRAKWALFVEGAAGGEAQIETQARDEYFLFRSLVEQALNDLYAAESKLRYMMGLAATDGRLIRPADEPTTAKVVFDWCDSHAEALCRSVELREQKWGVKRRELELIAAKNWLLPRLDFVGRYRWLGLGDHLINSNNTSGSQFDNAYENMTMGNFQEWHVGVDLSFPIGFRREMAGVRHAQLNIARARAVLQEMELEVSHQLAHAIRELEAKLVLTQTNFNRRVAAQRRLDAIEAIEEAGAEVKEGLTIFDLKLEAGRRLADAEIAYYRSLIDYNKSIAQVHYRKGSLLEYNGVYLAEGPWTGKAYFDAHRRARARDASYYLDYGFTRPKVVSQGPIEQHPGGGPMLLEGEIEEIGPMEAGPELVPTPAPEPLAPVPEPQAGGPGLNPPKLGGLRPAADITRSVFAVVKDNPEKQKSDLPEKGPAGKPPVPADGWSAVKRASFQRPAQQQHVDNPEEADAGRNRLRWAAPQSVGTWHESVANPSPAETHRPAAGWTGVQR